MLVEPNFAGKITKACCVLHNFIRRRDGFNFENTLNCGMDRITKGEELATLRQMLRMSASIL